MAKSENISVKITPEQKVRWQTWADKKDKTLPEFIRTAVEVYITMMEKMERQKA